ncbi:hypothetical protein TNCV_3000801 [Trichonephila clavipes]|nr:hypothetical protein TNCV_3000801 [Trichonephila clavipes]
MFDPSSFANPTPLAHADTSRDVLPREGTSQMETWRDLGDRAKLETNLAIMLSIIFGEFETLWILQKLVEKSTTFKTYDASGSF